MRVLIIDDYAPFATSLRLLLGPRHDVAIDVGGRAGLERLQADDTFDLVFCDLVMPDVSGMALYGTLARERPELLRRIVFVTGGAYPPEARAFLDAVRPTVLEKPFTAEALHDVLRRVAGPANPENR